MNGIYLLMGSNLGNKLSHLKAAEQLLIASGVTVLEESSIYETQAWGKEDQDTFLNVVLEIETGLNPEELLINLLNAEERLGRVRTDKWGARIIDIDILYYHDKKIQLPDLIIPHPGIPDRRFTLIPLVEMNPFGIHPILNKTQVQLLADCSDPLDCKITNYTL